MSANYFPVQSSILSSKALLREVNLRYGIKALQCRLWSIGLNDVYLILEEDCKYFLRVSHEIRFSKKDYEEELTVILQLKANAINTCMPVGQQDNTYIWEITAPEGIRVAVLFEEVRNDNTESTYKMGELAASIHRVSDEINFQISRQSISLQQLIIQPIKSIGEANVLKEADMKFLEESSKQMWNDLTDIIPKEAPYYGFCHGDIHSGNVYFENRVPQIFDFDCMGDGYRVYDLCVYLWDETSVKEDFMNSEEWKDYLKGYEEVRKLSETEIVSIPAFAALRQLWFMGLIIDATDINNSWDGINNIFFTVQLKRYKFWYQGWKNNRYVGVNPNL